MCQKCVTDGLMTAEMLAKRVAEGDKTVMPLVDLSPTEALDSVAKVMAEAINAGVPFMEALDESMRAMEAYVSYRLEHGATPEELAVVMGPVE
jgi:hypothetical protein